MEFLKKVFFNLALLFTVVVFLGSSNVYGQITSDDLVFLTPPVEDEPITSAIGASPHILQKIASEIMGPKKGLLFVQLKRLSLRQVEVKIIDQTNGKPVGTYTLELNTLKNEDADSDNDLFIFQLK